MYTIILSNVILLSLVNLYFNRIVFRGQAFYKIQFLFLCFVILHSMYIIVARSFFEKSLFWDMGAPFGLFYGPFFYIGLSLLINDGSKVLEKYGTHFVIGILFVPIFFILSYFFSTEINVLKIYMITLYSLVALQMMGYAIFAYFRFNGVVKNKKSIAFMSQTLIVMLASALIFSAFVFSDLTKDPNVINGMLVYTLMFSAVIILFRYNVLVLVRKFNYYKKSYDGKLFFDYFKEQFITAHTAVGEENRVSNKTREPLEEEVVKYQKSRISEEEMKEYLKNLESAWQSKIYLNPDLTLNLLSKTLHIPKYHLTQVFNLGLNSNFNKFINALRVQHAVVLLDDPDNVETIEEIMMQSGFNSRSSFYRAFNVYYDISPADYRKQANL